MPASAGSLPPRPIESEAPDIYALADTPTAGATARQAAARAAVARSGSAPAEAAPTRPTRTPMQILAAFRGEIRPVRPTVLYRLWVLIIAGFMILLPAVYLALVGLVGYGVFRHATENISVFREVRSAKAALFLYAAPLVVGGVVIAFMLKPLFARSSGRTKVRKLDPSKEPLVAAFVDGVCSSVGAPTPSRIEVNCEVNASAHLASWVLSPSRELVLTIGLPLVAGLSLKQFTGVLAHEFGHFSQGVGMRLSVLIRSINLWFVRVVYQRDEWDEQLMDLSREGHVFIMLVAGLARVCVWATRRILWALMLIGHGASAFLSRQMEFDADRYEARMVGGPTFASTTVRFRELNLACQVAHAGLQANWREGRLPDDLPRLVRVEAAKIPEPIRASIRNATRTARSGLFDSHPPDAARIARALIEAPEGIFSLDGPATDLFRDFDALARSATFDHYRAMLGREVTKDQLFPVSDALLDRDVQAEGGEAFDRFFLDGLAPMQALPLPTTYPSAPADPKAAKRACVAARRAMPGALDSSRAHVELWGELLDWAGKAEAALALLKAGKTFKPAEFDLPRATIPAAESARDANAAEILANDAALEPFGRAATDRLLAALALLELDAAVARVPEGAARRDEARALYPAASALGGRIMLELSPVLRAYRALGVLVEKYQAGRVVDDAAMNNALRRGGRALHDRLTELRWKIGDATPYPFEHAREGISLGQFALPAVPGAEEIGDLLQVASEAMDRIIALHRRVLGRLAATAEAVERAVGLPPLEAPTIDGAETDA